MSKSAFIKRAAAGIAALVIVFACVGCENSSGSIPAATTAFSEADKPSKPAEPALSDKPEETEPAEALPVISEEPPETDKPAETTETAAAAEPAESLESHAPEESAEEDTPAPAETSEIQTEQTPEQTTASAPQTTQPPPKTTTAPPVTTAKPVEVVIPKVKKLSSPEKNAAVNEKGVIDYSNASEGYIAVKYVGGSDKAKLRLSVGDIKNDHTVSVGITEYIPLINANGTVTAQLYEHLEGKSYAKVIEAEFDPAISDETGRYLYPNKYCMFGQNSECVAKAAELCAGKSGTVEKLAAIFGWVSDNVSYDYDLAASVTSGYVPDPDKTLAKRSGICFDYACLITAMTRSQGIPTRLVIGYAGEIYHAWNEVWTEETGWITPELLLEKKGYNRVDATFYSSSNNKESIAQYISDNGNYSVVYIY